MKKTIKIIAIIVAVCLLLTSAWFLFGKKILERNISVIESANYEINGEMLSYFIDEQRDSYASYYSKNYGESYLTSIGLDVNKSLKSQKSSYGGTWYDYFYGLAIDDIKETLCLCEAAYEQGLTLDEKETKEIKAKAEKIKGYSSNTVLSALKLKAIAEKYKQSFYDSLSYSEEDYNSYYNQNHNEFDCVDYKFIEIKAEYNSDMSNADTAMLDAKKEAEALSKRIGAVGFDKAVHEYLSKTGRQENIADMAHNEYLYEMDTNFGGWAFSGGRKDGDVTIFEGDKQYSVYYLERAPYKLDYTVRKVQILVIPLGSDGAESAITMYGIVEKMNSKENTDENFASLSENVQVKPAYKSEISEKLRNWVYSDERKIGDYEVIEDTADLNLVRYIGEDGTFFKMKAHEKLCEQDYNKALGEYAKKYKITVK